jgi:hypothetical protein
LQSCNLWWVVFNILGREEICGENYLIFNLQSLRSLITPLGEGRWLWMSSLF